MKKFIVPRRDMAAMGWPRPLIELVAQLADFAQAQIELDEAQTDITDVQATLTTLLANVARLQTDVSELPLLIDPLQPYGLEIAELVANTLVAALLTPDGDFFLLPDGDHLLMPDS